MKTLRTIQILSKVGKILSKIVFILSLVGGIGCAVGIAVLAVAPEGLKLGGVTLHSMIEKSDMITLGICYAAMATGMVFCAGEAVLAKIAERYFGNELAAGTPFTADGAKELTRLGICAICIPIVSEIVAEIVFQIMKHGFDDIANFETGDPTSIGLGIALILAGLLCKYGAELSASVQPEAPRSDT